MLVTIGRGKAQVPGANLLTDVAAENPVTHLGAQVDGNGVLKFDRQIGDTTAGIQCAVGQDAVRGAGLDAARATAAMVSLEGGVYFQFNAQKDLGQHEVRSRFRVDQHAVFADPSEARHRCQIAFQDGAGVGVPAVGDSLWPTFRSL